MCNIEINVGLYNTAGDLQSISDVKVYFTFDPPTTMLYEGWVLISSNGRVIGTIYQCCQATLTLIAEANNYDMASTTISITDNIFGTCSYIGITVNGDYFCINEDVQVTGTTDCTYGTDVTDVSFEIYDVYGSSINGEYSVTSSVWPKTVVIQFPTVGVKKIVGVIGEFYAKNPDSTIQIEQSSLYITFPNGTVSFI